MNRLRLFALVAVLLLTACGTQPAAGPAPGGSPAPAATAGGTLVVGLIADPITLDAQAVGDNNTRRAVYPIFDPLVRESADKTAIEPALAETWDTSSDGLVYTLHLRKGVKFHDGEPFNAAAVKFNLDRQIDPNHPNFKDGNWLFQRLLLSPIKQVDVVDEYTVNLVLKAPFAPLLDHLSANPSYMMSPKAIKQWGKDVGQHPVGTGPFKFVSWDKGQKLVLERNDDYWGEKAKLDKLVFVPIAEPQARLTALQTGQVQMTIDLAPDVVETVKNDANLQVVSKPSRQIWGVQLNSKFGPFSKKEVRQAVAYAINREALVKDVLKGTGVASKGPMSEAFGEFVAPDAPTYAYDPTKAKQLLTAAGYANGFDVTFMIPSAGSGMQQPVPMAEFIQSNLAAIGIRPKLQVLEWGAYVQRWNAGDFQMSARAITSNCFDPDITINGLFNTISTAPAGLNTVFYASKPYDDLANGTRVTLAPDQRRDLVRQADKVLMEDSPWAFVDHEIDMYYLSKSVRGFQVRGNFLIDFNKITLGK